MPCHPMLVFFVGSLFSLPMLLMSLLVSHSSISLLPCLPLFFLSLFALTLMLHCLLVSSSLHAPVFGMFTLHPSHNLLLTIPYKLLIALFLVLILSPSPTHLSSPLMMLIHLFAIYALLVHLPLSSHWSLLRSVMHRLMIALPLLIFVSMIFIILRPYGQ